MQLLKFIPIKLTIFLVLGILIGHYFDTGIRFPVLFTVLFIIILGVLFRRNSNRKSILFGVATLFLTTAIGVSAVSLWKPKNQSKHYSNQNYQNAQVWKVKIQEVLKSSSFSNRYIAIVLSMDEQPATGKIILSIPPDSTKQKLQVDEELIAIGKLSEINSPLNPHQFDYKNYLEKLGIYNQLRLYGNAYVLTENAVQTKYGIAASLRTKISSKLSQANFGSDELSIIQALLLGQRNDISEETYTNYKDAGAVHILAVSGLHIGILLLLLQFLLQPLELLAKGKTIKLIVIVLLLWCFALLAGFSASVVRAVTMFSFVAYALYLNRPSNTFNILALSMFFILLVINPMLLFHVGFQMSYAAVFAIVWLYPLLQRFWFPKNIILKKIWQLLSVSIAAQLGVLPISLFYFHQFPGLFFVSNLLIIPFLGLILGMGIVVIILALLNMLPTFLARWYNSLIELMNAIIKWVAQQEVFIFKNISFDIIQLLLAYLTIITLLLIATKITFRRVALFLLGIIAFQVWLFYASYASQQKEKLFIAHQTKNSIIIHHAGNSLNVITSDSLMTNRIITDYQIAERVTAIKYLTHKNTYTFNDKNIQVVDSSGVYLLTDTDYIVLTQSPKINLERLIDSVKPKQIIADGSNYHSYVNRWKKTCIKRKLPFHYTGEKGVYYFDNYD